MNNISKSTLRRQKIKAIAYPLGVVAGVTISLQSLRYMGSLEGFIANNIGIAMFSLCTWMLLKEFSPKQNKNS